MDGEIVREGVYGDQGDGAYSAGVRKNPKHKQTYTFIQLTTVQRGGAGNIGSPMVRPTSRVPHDADMIPELAVRNSTDETYHTGVSTGILSLHFLDFP